MNLAEGVLRLVASAAPARTQSLLEYTGTRYIRESTKPPGVHRYQVYKGEYKSSWSTMVPGAFGRVQSFLEYTGIRYIR